MNFFKRWFTSDSKELPKSNPENTRLIFLLNNYGENNSQVNYELVMRELMEGNSFLIVPSINDGKDSDEWTVLQKDVTVKFTSAFNLDGLKVLGAFSDEAALIKWAKKPTDFTAIKAQAVLDICKQNKINRLVINSDSSTMFVLEQNSNAKSIDIDGGTKILVGTPAKPLPKNTIQNLVSNFREIDNVLEAYQYAQSKYNETSIVIAISLLSYSDNAKSAVLYAVQNAFSDLPKDTFADILFLDTKEWYDMTNAVENALFYKKDIS